MQINDLRVIVTGAASGLGRETALSLCRAGAKVAGVDINGVRLNELLALAKGLGGEMRIYRADVSCEQEVIQVVQEASLAYGFINALINSAGIYRDGLLLRPIQGKVLKMPLPQWKAVLDVDLTGLFLMTREVAAQMIEKEVRPGLILNLSSISRHGNIGQANYSAAKAGVVADTKVWTQELAPYHIRVAAIAPGFIRTPILQAMHPDTLKEWIARIPLARLGEANEIFMGVRFIVECEYFNGKCLDIDGGLTM
jgi:3-oxoacyl-[acyl-carrier protein] reductase